MSCTNEKTVKRLVGFYIPEMFYRIFSHFAIIITQPTITLACNQSTRHEKSLKYHVVNSFVRQNVHYNYRDYVFVTDLCRVSKYI